MQKFPSTMFHNCKRIKFHYKASSGVAMAMLQPYLLEEKISLEKRKIYKKIPKQHHKDSIFLLRGNKGRIRTTN